MYKRTYNNLMGQIKECEKSIEEKVQILLELENNNNIESSCIDKVKEFLEMKNPSRTLVSSLIDRIEIDENKTIDIYYNFRLI